MLELKRRREAKAPDVSARSRLLALGPAHSLSREICHLHLRQGRPFSWDRHCRCHRGARPQRRKADLSLVRQILAAKAITLDAMFSDMAARAAVNRGEYLKTSLRFEH